MDEKEIRAIAYANKRMEEYPNMEEGSGYIMWKRFKDAFRDGEEVQKAIDEAESGKELLYVVNKTTERVRKEMIEKACELLCKTCEIGICPIEHKCHRYKGFRKAMMEE